MGAGTKKCVCAPISRLGGAFANTRAEVHLDRFQTNVRNMLHYIGRDVQLLVVVKADAYGHGALAVGRSAMEAGANKLAVYTMGEALVLRKAGIEAPIIVFGPIEPWQAHKCAAYAITPCITSIELGEALSVAAGQAGVVIPYHVEVDTGLTRYGILPDEVLPLLQALDKLPSLSREGLFTHFATADEESKEVVWKQFKLFMKIRHILDTHDIVFPLYHVAASSATLDFPEMHLDMVRCGIVLYGYYPSPYVRRSVDVEPVMALGSELARVRTVSRGVGVSYGHDWRAGKRSTIGLVPFGYADGMPRTVQGKGHVLIRGQRAPIVGRVAMDQFMVDLTNARHVCQGDEVTIIGSSGEDEITADEIGEWAGTISYDVLSGISPRVPRLYISGETAVAERLGMTTEVLAVEAH